MKRLFDLIAAAALLLLLGIPMMLIGAVLGLSQGLPVFFRQERVGRHGHPFQIVKFRTMRHQSEQAQAVTSGDRDPRITPMGATLRRYRIDEWPQLLNVLRGEMSLVGPRPEVPQFVDAEDADWAVVLSVRPGLTGPDALAFKDEGAILSASENPVRTYREEILPEKLRIQQDYALNRSLAGDLAILFRTLGALRG